MPKQKEYLQIGINADCEVVMNLPRDMTGHIIFSIQEARNLAELLMMKAADAEKERRDRDGLDSRNS